MKISIYDQASGMRGNTFKLYKKMVSPLCGLDKSVSYMLRDRLGPKFYVAGGDLTGVHVLRNQPEPPKGFYHIGGCGIERQESIIRTLGETVERYTQFVSEIGRYDQIVFASYVDMLNNYESVLDCDSFDYFDEAQYNEAGFPYHQFSKTEPIGWLKVENVNGSFTWVPAQLFLVGYVLKKGEKWIQASVTTGSAAHITQGQAALNAILELIQLDTSMGHWHSNQVAEKIIFDERTNAIERIIQKHFAPSGLLPHFYLLQSPDLPGFTVSCLLKQNDGFPKVSIGQSCELKLQDAMYKALLEAVGVYHLARLKIFEYRTNNKDWIKNVGIIKDLDTNVAYYGMTGEDELIKYKFSDKQTIKASDIRADYSNDYKLDAIIKTFTDSGKRLFQLDTTTVDAKELGFFSWRYWSPDTLTLSLPGTPNKKHKRLRDFGGFVNAKPHPYP